jgi:hypothetical protein
MASPLVWKVFKGKQLVGATRYAEEAAALVSLQSDGIVRADGRIVWREGYSAGRDGHAGVSYDDAAKVMVMRRANHAQQRYERLTRNTEV